MGRLILGLKKDSSFFHLTGRASIKKTNITLSDWICKRCLRLISLVLFSNVHFREMEQDETRKRDSKGIFMTISSNDSCWFRSMRVERRRCFYSMKVSYYPNATAIFQFMMIFKSGNVALKPGPTAKALVEKKSCLVCSRTLARNHRAVECCFICKR